MKKIEITKEQKLIIKENLYTKTLEELSIMTGLNIHKIKRVRRVFFDNFILPDGFVEIPFDRKYACDNTGTIINIRTGRVISSSVSRKGYLQICLSNKKTYTIHRIVATCFIHNEDLSLEVNHKDGVKTNNHHTNLEWCTKLENIEHAVANNLWKTDRQKIAATGINNTQNVLSEEEVLFIRELYSSGWKPRFIWEKFSNKISRPSIYDIIKRKSWKHI
jgi:hypothetical protein